MTFDEPESAADDEGDPEEAYVEPVDETTKTTHYVPKDGRAPLVVTVGYTMLTRLTSPTAKDGVPPQYSGTISPGMSAAVTVYPLRFADGTGGLRNLGAFARGAMVWMRSVIADASPARVQLDVYYSIHAGAVYRHVFSERESAVAVGGELALAWDGMTAASTSPFPSTMYVSPLANALLEVPLAGRSFVWQTRVGIMPISWLGSAQTAFFGKQSHAWGLRATTGFRSTLWRDLLYAEVEGIFGHYWQHYGAPGAAGLQGVVLRDLTLGFNLAAGVTY